MAWTWRLEDETGAGIDLPDGATPSFPSQADAETWLGEEWPSLVDAGVDHVFLLEGDRQVYGPMSLHA